MRIEHVLLVDDSPACEETASVLQPLECEVTAVTSISDALAAVRSNQIDVVVTEYTLPDGDGIELLETVTKIGAVPVILYTDDGDEHVASRAIDAGVASYLPKSRKNAPDRLVETIRNILGERHPPADQMELPEVTPETIVEAVDETPVGVVISDPSLPDNPIIYLNDAFERMTGYKAEEVLGRNCRFLQGPDTDEKAVAEIRKGVENNEPVTVELLNYRKDGTPFWNQVTVSPLFDENGDVTHFVGFQNDVTERKNAQKRAQERAEALQHERETLERILGRVSGTVNEISQILVTASNRDQLEQRVCTELAKTEGYTHAWIGEKQPVGSTLTVRVHGETQESPGSNHLEIDPTGTAFERALEEEAVIVATDEDDLPASVAPAKFDATALAVVPITYQRATYGLLAVYAEESAVLDSHECTVFEAIGQMIASGINAVETKQVLTADRVTELGFEITDEAFPLIELATAAGGSITYNGSTINDGDSFRLFVTITGLSEPLAELIERCETITDGLVVARQDDRVAVSVEFADATPFEELAEYGGTIRDISASAATGTAQVHIDLPVEGDVRSVRSVLEAAYDGVNLIRQRERTRDPQPTAEFIGTVSDRLTERQLTALETAYFSNYFEFPRPVSGEQLAETMDISRQTYHQHLRAAQRKLLEEFFESASFSQRNGQR